jgi:hypothetical protein
LRWRPEPAPFIRIERWTGKRAGGEVSEAHQRLVGRNDRNLGAVRAVLDATIETVAFELKGSDVNTMGWPVAGSGAAWVAAQGDGLVHADGDGWLKPTPQEVERLLAEA